jgi:hypothetical protein
MSSTSDRSEPVDDDLVAPPADEDERAEAEWLLARERDPAAPPPSPEIAREYAELEDLLANLPMGARDQSWHAEVLRAAASTSPATRLPWWRRTTRTWTIAAAVASAAIIVGVVVLPRDPDRPREELAVRVIQVALARSGPADVVPGDRAVVTANPSGALADLRIYRRNGTLVARCPPAGPLCRSSPDGGYTIELTLDEIGTYEAVLVLGMANAPEPVDQLLRAVDAGHARITRKTIEVK